MFPAIDDIIEERNLMEVYYALVIPYAQKSQVSYLILIGLGKKRNGKIDCRKLSPSDWQINAHYGRV